MINLLPFPMYSVHKEIFSYEKVTFFQQNKRKILFLHVPLEAYPNRLDTNNIIYLLCISTDPERRRLISKKKLTFFV